MRGDCMKGSKKFSIVMAFAFASAFMVDGQGAMTQQENDGSYYVIHNSMLGWNKARMVAGSGGAEGRVL